MKFKIINDLTIFLDNNVPEKYLSVFQEFLLSGSIFTDASTILAVLIMFIIISEILLMMVLTFFSLPVSILISPFFIIPILFSYVIVCQEKRTQKIENSSPDFLRQLSNMLQVGLSFEKT
ncbi:MAG: hypothetical protein ACI389_06150 [Methanobrevibacter sp.]|uniref:hypothetical protein n=1 Tax=Methanobrevibacter sp. TaxID=66852 RepID=UPI003F100D7A